VSVPLYSIDPHLYLGRFFCILKLQYAVCGLPPLPWLLRGDGMSFRSNKRPSTESRDAASGEDDFPKSDSLC